MTLALRPQAAPSAPRPQATAGSRSAGGFARFAAEVHDRIGVKLSASKQLMVEGRLRRRVATLGLPDIEAYFRFLFEQDGLETEIDAIIDAVTTNKTDFFREPEHFDLLIRRILPERLAARPARGSAGMFKVWSAAASTGVEAYTTAMVLAEAARRLGGFEWGVLGTDINSEVLEAARRGVYSDAVCEPVPPDCRDRYLMQGRGGQAGRWRIAPELRRRVRFNQLNLMDARYPVETGLDVIFLRNVLIYFDPADQARVISNLARHLGPGGHLFVGHSESMIVDDPAFQQIGPSVFRKVVPA